MAVSPLQLRQNYHLDCEAAGNVEVQLQLYTSYMYLSMAIYCKRLDVALKHCSNFFLRRPHQWKELAEKLMWMQTDRGGHVIFGDIMRPERNDWCGGVQAMECAFYLEKTINQSLMELHQLATKKGDSNLCDFVQCHYLRPQVQVLKEMGDHWTNIHKIGNLEAGLANYLFESLPLEEGCNND